MAKLISIGEALIDFMADEKGAFIKSPGGAPANVAACVARLGGKSQLITKLGEDIFGDFLYNVISNAGIDSKSIFRTNKYNTGLAFVSHKQNGERKFMFYRDPSADMMLNEDEICEEWFEKGDILHFCSVDLIDAPVRKAHDIAIEYARKNEGIICFDPNVRLPLWKDHDDYKRIINKYIECANILKISNDEIEFITGIKDEETALKLLLDKVNMLIYTKGSEGAVVLTNEYTLSHNGFKVKAIDTTGAGDSFIGSFLYKLLDNKIDILEGTIEEDIASILEFSNKVAAFVVSKKGTINIMPSLKEIV